MDRADTVPRMIGVKDRGELQYVNPSEPKDLARTAKFPNISKRLRGCFVQGDETCSYKPSTNAMELIDDIWM